MKNLILILTTWSILFFSCQNEFENITSNSPSISEVNINGQPLAFPDMDKGEVKEGYYLGQKIRYTKHKGYNIYQGDILLRSEDIKDQPMQFEIAPENIKSTSRSVGRVLGRWPNNTVYYSIQGSLPNKNRIHDAIKHWEQKTNLRFKKRTTESNFIFFRFGDGCSSHVGMQGGKQTIQLANGCNTGAVIHEIGHAIGLNHEQNRLDRDDFVKIHYNNIVPNMEHNFDKAPSSGFFQSKDYTKNLDFKSVMLYDSFAFSKNNRPTITKLNGQTYTAFHNVLSKGDINGVKKMYPANSSRSLSSTNPEFINNTGYNINGLLVLRKADEWLFYDGDQEEWIKLQLINGKWYRKV